MRRMLAAATLALACIPLTAQRAAATHDPGLFELDGNAVNGSGGASYDWNSLFPVDRSSSEIAKVFVRDGVDSPADVSFFAGGGSKDIYDLTEWLHSPGDVAPDKDEISSAWAVAYSNPVDTGRNNAGDLVLYFGADRFANNGDAQVGFWFFRGDVGRNPDGTFAGAHSVNDLLILSDFTQGGRVSDVRLFRWVGSGGSDGPLDFVASGGDCLDASPDDALCAEVNSGSQAAPWPYTPKSVIPGTFPAGSFYEGGVNVTRLMPGVRCFGAYLAETRSSQSVSAVLKDLALGPFNTCPRSAAPGFGTPVTTAQGGTAPLLPRSGPLGTAARALSGLALVGGGAAMRRTNRSRALGREDGRAPTLKGEADQPISITGFILYG